MLRKYNITRNLIALCLGVIFLITFFCFSSHDVLAQYGEENLGNINLPRIEFIASVVKVINYALGFLALVAFILVIYAGILWMTAGGDSGKVDKARKILINALIGLVIIILSGAITFYVFDLLQHKINDYNNNGGGGDDNPEEPYYPPFLPDNLFKISSITTSCGNGEDYHQDVFLCSAVTINFNHFLNNETVKNAVNSSQLKLEECSDSNCTQTSVPSIYPASYSATLVTSGSGWSSSGRSIVFTHENLFKKNQYYRLVISKSIKDVAGVNLDSGNGCGNGFDVITNCVNGQSAYLWTFQTGEKNDTVKPTIKSSYPVFSGTKYPDRNVNLKPVLWVKFSEPIMPVIKENIKLVKINGTVNNQGVGGTLGAAVDFSVANNSLGNGVEIYDLIFEPFTWYEITIKDIKDLCQNSLAAAQIWRFQTNDLTPGLRFVYPANNYANACPDTSIYAIFNTSMYNPETGSCRVGANGGYVTGGSLTPAIAGRLFNVASYDNYPGGNFDPNDYCHVYEFAPATVNLKPDTAYTAKIETNLVKDLSGNKLSATWNFGVKKSSECANAPVITKLSPASGPDGACLTIFGKYFDVDKNGQGTGDKLNLADKNLTPLTNGWHNNYITTNILNPSGLEKNKNYSVQVSVDRGATFGVLKSNSYNFFLTAAAAASGPCLSNINPDAACFGQNISASGQRFVSGTAGDKPKLLFTPGILAEATNFTDTSLNSKISNQITDGEVKVINAKGESNPLPFDLMCNAGAVCATDVNLCAIGDGACASGYDCVLKNNSCLCQTSPVGKPCSTNTNQCMPSDALCDDPVNYFCHTTNCKCQRRDTVTNPKPQVVDWWPRGCNDACLNVSLGARFNLPMNASLLTNENVLTYRCADNSCAKDKLAEKINTQIDYVFDDTLKKYQIIISPENNLAANTYYRIIIKNVILAENGQGLTGLNFIFGTGSANDSFSWVFSTSDKTCVLNGVELLPSEKTIDKLGVQVSYRASALGGNNTKCGELPLNSYNYNWNWESNNSLVATVLRGYDQPCQDGKECSSGVCQDKKYCTGKNPRNIATVTGWGETKIKATALSGSNPNATAVLKIIPPDGEIIEPISLLAVYPDPTSDSVSCTNIVGNVLFNQPLNTASLADNFKLYFYTSEDDYKRSQCPDNMDISLVSRDLSWGQKIWSKIKKIVIFWQSAKAAGDEPYWCKKNINLKSTLLKNKEKVVINGKSQECNNNQGCTLIKWYPKEPLLKDSRYQIFIKGGADGIKGANGSLLAKDKELEFKTNSTAAICKIDHLLIDPNKRLFTQRGDAQDFFAQILSKEKTELSPINQVYDWTYNWSKTDEKNIVNLSSPANDNKIIATANNQNGQAVLKLELKVTNDVVNHTENTTYTAFANLENNLCLNPWVYEDDSNYGHFSLFYCRDRGLDKKTCLGGQKNGEVCEDDTACPSGTCVDQDNLPALKENPAIKTNICYGENTATPASCPSGTCANGGVCVLKEYLFLRTDDSTDAIGLRIFANTNHLTARSWYDSQSFLQKGGGQNIVVDRYDSIKDGRSVYVSAANLATDKKLYTNIYLMSYNENSSSDTQEIFQRLLEKWRFNTNEDISDLQICDKTTTKKCTKDSECPSGEKCNALKTKLIRDTKRLTDLSSLAAVLTQSYDSSDTDETKKHYPALSAGSYKIGYSTSKWPSWNSTFASELGAPVPLDPLNGFNLPCITPESVNEKFDQESCWNDIDKEFICPAGSFVYQYQTEDNGTSYKIYGKMEYDSIGSWKNGDFGACANFSISH